MAVLSRFSNQFFTNDGKPAAGHKLFFYEGGSFSTPQAVFSDAAETELTNPVVADASGRVPAMWLLEDTFYNVAFTTPDEAYVLQSWVNIKA